MGFPDSSVGKESACNAGDPGSIPGLGRSPGEGTGYPLQYSWASLVAQLVKNPPAMWETWVRSLCWEDPGGGKGCPLQYSGLENSMDCIVHGVIKSRTRLRNFHFRNSITMNKASGGNGIPAELFQILKDDAVKVLHSICQQIWKTQQWPQDWKRSVFILVSKNWQCQRMFKLLYSCAHFTS